MNERNPSAPAVKGWAVTLLRRSPVLHALDARGDTVCGRGRNMQAICVALLRGQTVSVCAACARRSHVVDALWSLACELAAAVVAPASLQLVRPDARAAPAIAAAGTDEGARQSKKRGRSISDRAAYDRHWLGLHGQARIVQCGTCADSTPWRQVHELERLGWRWRLVGSPGRLAWTCPACLDQSREVGS